MLISMTGYGRAEQKIGDLNVVVELRTVNSRFLEFVLRFPRGYEKVEDAARAHLQSILGRGRVTVSMNLGTDQSAIGKPQMNESLLLHYQQIANKSTQILGRESETLSISELLRFPDVITYSTDSKDQEEFDAALMDGILEASKQLQEMRFREGELLEQAILGQLEKLVEITNRIQAEGVGRLDVLAEKLRKKIAESAIDGETKIDEKRLEQEIVLWSDKLDITEELTRLEAHVQHFRELMHENGDAGKRLNFLLQEMNREANTVGSKANSTPIGHAVVELKNEIERIREQVQNIQ
ncbi:MAG: YicC family protein [Candidatus Marinimicrobia bacterium]|nr:YicC family protein [Candidatus Neomarinimicrobiota bacterium]